MAPFEREAFLMDSKLPPASECQQMVLVAPEVVNVRDGNPERKRYSRDTWPHPSGEGCLLSLWVSHYSPVSFMATEKWVLNLGEWILFSGRECGKLRTNVRPGESPQGLLRVRINHRRVCLACLPLP